MRKISLLQISIFCVLMICTAALTFMSVKYTIDQIDLGDFRGVLLVFSGIIVYYLYAILFYRLMFYFYPVGTGEIKENSLKENICHLHTLFFLVLFYPVIKSSFIPVPIMRIYYLLLGADLGSNTYSAGYILDPIFVSIGDNTLVGSGATIISHILENSTLAYYHVKIGNNVTIGANAVLMSGVTIEDNALVAIGAVVKKHTHIKAGEVWAGIPAIKINKDEAPSFKKSPKLPESSQPRILPQRIFH